MLTARFIVDKDIAHTFCTPNPSSLQSSPLPFHPHPIFGTNYLAFRHKNSSFKLEGNKEKTTRTLCFTNGGTMSQGNQELCPSLCSWLGAEAELDLRSPNFQFTHSFPLAT